jgi:hypothetical protein
MGYGAAGADGARARGAEGVSVAQGVQVVGHSDSVDSEVIIGAGAQHGAEVVVAQDSTEADHGAAMENIPMDYGAAYVEEGNKAGQDELAVEGPMGNGIVGADGAQASEAEGVRVARSPQLVGSSGSMGSGGMLEQGNSLVRRKMWE